MFSTLQAAVVLGFTILPVLASGPLPRKTVVRELVVRDDGTIPALLRSPFPRSTDGLVVRQTNTCAVGFLPCSDGSGCCPIGEYCGTWGGLLGCCPNGETCVANDSQECDYVGYTLCSGEDFCCPTGDLCYRDSTGSPACSDPSSGGSGGTSALISSAFGGTTFVSGTTKAVVTSATVSRSVTNTIGFTTNVQAGTLSSTTRSVVATGTAGEASASSGSSSAASSQTTGLSGLGGNGAGANGVSFNIFALAICSTLVFIIFN
ncbi:hypothetical protein EDD18DRAFT_1346844 [Armillaria luteobubalina]|uniref:GPI anchored protein n=1 Tax=Armillaria luteobubalina TaxID=153913 RepID=A0AA39QIG9_9AGAR|nr:hypothetical protein EDD18DRAFT_1346844 [Armillaria luteobubalina]